MSLCSFQILGRRVLQVRICSCPKRDKEKAEKEFHQQGNKDAAVLIGKKRKADKTSKDLEECKVSFKVLGKHNYLKILNYAADLMRSEAYLHGANAESNFKRILTDLNNQLSKLIFDVCIFLIIYILQNRVSKETIQTTVPVPKYFIFPIHLLF